jgi:hypothetical protein
VPPESEKAMKKILMAASVLLLATAAVPASAQSFFGLSIGSGNYGGGYGYGNGYGGYGNGYSNNGGYGNGYGSYGSYGGYGRGYNRGYSGYNSPYSSYQNDYREHAQLHRDLRNAHGDAHEEGIYGAYDHADTHDALDSVHDQYHYNRGY